MVEQVSFREVNKITSENECDSDSHNEGENIEDAKASVFIKSWMIPENTDIVKGLNFDKEVKLHEFINQYKYMGFQATNLGISIDEINKMIYYKYKDDNIKSEEINKKNNINQNNVNDDCINNEENNFYNYENKKKNCIIWLSFTSNMISSGLREIFVYLAKNKFIDVVVTTAGGIEEDIIKCFSNTYIGDFNLNGKKLRKKGWNRIGNLIVPNDNYCKFEDWLQPILNRLLHEQNEKNEQIFLKKLKKRNKKYNNINRNNMCGMEKDNHNTNQYNEYQENFIKQSNINTNNISNKNNNINNNTNYHINNYNNDSDSDDEDDMYYLSPSEFINILGKEINHESSLIYWCYKNDIPIFCPGLTDGSLGDNLFFHNYGRKIKNNLILDIVKDIKKINSLAMNCNKSGIIILGGGLPKHHVCNANLMRNGADYAVYVNTANEYDGSDSGANTTEALSWGKIKYGQTNNHVKVFGDATILFPLMVLNSFYLYDQNRKKCG
ncbi:deoxyhypusine synthase [Plasmodium gaboni]|uniref:Deoxyhypusine synthase n=1 Tax=Plasmodium gaboni TaxID=647221 RepID=A0A151L9Y7_9APIC|nr:deoxyhypusine synthase [Plasmodium gaboni]KYN95739.1 deoxyhypusine synthase [Plasmodium gaboni]SOV24867.1 deoxyhypusine synthase [Plasmodium sp. DRC-Itaito]